MKFSGNNGFVADKQKQQKKALIKFLKQDKSDEKGKVKNAIGSCLEASEKAKEY